ncbi:MAG: Wzz/FepE/Etk N-terminal domain-containing protein [Bryobacteraceae bacterium]|jgi:polysaccharide chain length determinant protein (PEP-CTERM system associated)
MFPLTSGPSAHPEMSPLSLARMLWKSKTLIGLIWIFLGLLVGAAVYMVPAEYRAEAVILVDGQKVPERYVASTANADVQDRLATISQQILATSRLQKIIDTYHLYQREKGRLPQEEIIEKMRSDTKITLERGWSQERTSAFRIAYQGRDPATVAEVANQIGNLFIEENLRTRENHAAGTSEFIEEQLQQASKTLTALEAQVEQYKLRHKGELPEQEGSLAGALSRGQIELQANQDAINRAGQSKALLSTSLTMAESTAKVLERTLGNRNSSPGAGGNAVSNVASLQAELDAMRLRYTEEHPDVQRLEKMVAQARQSERAALTEPRPSSALTEPRPSGSGQESSPASPGLSEAVVPDLLQQRERIAGLRTELGLASRDLDLRTVERKDILTKIAALQSRMDTLPVREQELTALSRDYEIAKANYKSLLDKRLSADMATDLERRQQGERFTMIDPAQAPAKPFSPDRLQWTGIGCALSLLIAVGAGLVREMKRNVLLGEWELPPDIPILGRITAIVPATGARGL